MSDAPKIVPVPESVLKFLIDCAGIALSANGEAKFYPEAIKVMDPELLEVVRPYLSQWQA